MRQPKGPRDYLVGDFEPLYDRFPTALANVYCYAEVGPGWVPLVIPVLEACESEGVAVHQIKEKFGGLRIYTDRRNERVDVAIKAAETTAWKTCEECGQPGTQRGGGWIYTACEPCDAARAERQAARWSGAAVKP